MLRSHPSFMSGFEDMRTGNKANRRAPWGAPHQLWDAAVAAYERGEFRRARNAVAPLVEQGVAEGEPYLLAGLVEARLGHWKTAEPLLRRATQRLPERIEGWVGLGNAQRIQGRADEAAAAYREALKRRPDSVEALNNLAVAYEDMRLDIAALECHERVLDLAPGYENALRSRPALLARLGRGTEARTAYEDLIRRWPEDATLRLELAELLEKANQPGTSVEWLPDTEALPNPVAMARAEALRARLLARGGDLEGALERLVAARQRTGRDVLGYDEGQLLDRLGRPDEAMRAFRRANTARSKEWRFRRLRNQELLEYLEHKIRRGLEPASSPDAADSGGENAPVFLVGLPRSGTTLLERILAAHPSVQVLEEYEALRPAEAVLAANGTPAEARAAYYEHLQSHVSIKPGRVVVDKNPLHTIHLDVVPRVFPSATVLLALRHPYDAALSCYMQNFAPSPASVHFLELEPAAILCARLLEMIRLFESGYSERVVRIHYEDLVADFREVVMHVLTTIGLTWDERVAEYADTTARADLITTPSYEQVTRALDASAVHRWRRYDAWLGPIPEHLAPLLPVFGYTE